MISSNNLSKFDMNSENGLVWVSESNDIAINETEILAIEEAKKYKADAIYFRRFEKTSVPQVYIYERSLTDDDLLEIHKALWSSGIVPLFYVITETELKVYNCTKSANEKRGLFQTSPIETFLLIADLQKQINDKKYSARLFDNGTFWEEHQEILDINNSPYKKLLSGLLEAKKYLEQKYPAVTSKTISKLLIMSILVRYLEEKRDENGVKLFDIERDFIEQFPNSSKFTDILRNGQATYFFEKLAHKFNGKIFDLDQNEILTLQDNNLSYVAAIFDGTIEGKQFVLWELYSFNHLPIELISGIYEAFLKKEGLKKKDVVYTPPFLVNFLIDECMPLHKAQEYFNTETFKVLDPACGSGIFLVAALKRMVQWKAIISYKKTGKVEYPSIEEIKRITKNNIFGVDIEGDATMISVFSLCIALCDKLSPMQIWHDLRFDDLSESNILHKNFFEFYNQTPKASFDLIIGNPPFNPSTGESNKACLHEIKIKYNVEPKFPINDDNLALFFLDKGIELCKKQTGTISLILPAGAWLYNSNAASYHTSFLKEYHVNKIIDFTHLSDKIFHGSANIAVCVPIAQNKLNTDKRELYHIVVKRTKAAEERFLFEIDHYDFHKVSYYYALENPSIWKSNLFGGGRLFKLLDYLMNLRNLGEFLETKKKNNWVIGEGYIVGHDGSIRDNRIIYPNSKSKTRYQEADWITLKESVVTPSFINSGYKVFTELATFFKRPKEDEKEIFQAPHILIKKNLGDTKIPMAFVDEYLCFKDKIIGIHAPQEFRNELLELYNTLNSEQNARTNRFVAVATSGQAGVTLSEKVLYKEDLMNLPYPKNPKDLILGDNELIVRDDVLNYYIKSSISSLNSPLNKTICTDELEDFGKVFCNVLNPIYEQNDQKWFPNHFEINDSIVIYSFGFGKQKNGILTNFLGLDLDKVENLIYHQSHRNARITRVIRHYSHIGDYDILILVKPKSKRYWLKSIALRDADETFSDLKKAGF